MEEREREWEEREREWDERERVSVGGERGREL